MDKIMFYPLYADYEILNKKPIIKIFGRNEKGEKIVFEDKNFEPYFYAIPEQDKIEEIKKRIENLVVKHNEEKIKIKRVEIVERIEINKKLKVLKIFCYLPRDVSLLKEEVRHTKGVLHKREYDIPFAKRYCIDKQISFLSPYKIENNELKKQEGKLYNPNVAAFDIEIYKPSFDAKENKIICIGIYSRDKKIVFTWKPSNLKEAVVLKDEKEMIKKFFESIDEFDILLSYNGDNFDLPFLKIRAEELKLQHPVVLSRRGANFKNCLHVDLYNIVSKHLSAEIKTKSFKLDEVAKFFIGEGKDELKLYENNLGKDIWDSGDIKKIDEILNYNLQDCKITYLVGEKVLPLEYRFSNLIGLDLYDVTRSGFSQLVENYLIKESVRKGILINNKPTDKELEKRREQTYIGGYVHEPKPGIYEGIHVLDFKSLYPSILVSHNISPDTLDENGELEVKINGKVNKFTQKRKGFIVDIVDNLIKKRMEIKKKQGKGVNEKALKLLANSTYGYLGFFAARWYCLECAESITALGRKYIKETIEKAEKSGFKVVYGDSLDYSRRIIVKDNEGKIKIIKIGELAELNWNNYKTLTFDLKTQKVNFSKIKRVIRKPYDYKEKGKLVKITTTRGQTIVTPQHSLYKYENGKIILTDSSKLKEGDFLISLSKIPANQKFKVNSIIDIAKLNYRSELYGYKDNLVISKEGICPYCKKRYKWLREHVYSKHKDKKISIDKIKDEYKYIGFKYGRTGRIPRFWKIDEDLAWIIGYYCGDGSATIGRKSMLSFGSSNKKYIIKVKKFFDRILNKNLKIIESIDKRTGNKMYYYRVQNKTLVALFVEGFGMGKGCNNKKVPDIILNGDEKLKKSFLKGYFDSDGSNEKDWGRGYKSNYFRFTTNSKDLAIGVHLLLKSINFGKNSFGRKINTVAWGYRKDKPKISNLRLTASKNKKYEFEDFSLAKVNKIELVKPTKNFVYDIEVEKYHNFADAEGLVLVHNTDSTMLVGEKEKVKKFLEEINKELPKIMELEYEGFYKRGIFVGGAERGTKKRYALIDEKGNIEIKGFEFVRGDWSDIAKETQEKVLEFVLNNKKEEAIQFVKEIIKKIKKGNIEKEKLIISRQLTKKLKEYGTIAPHVKVARDLEKTGIKINRGTIIQYIITKDGKTISEKAKWYEEAKNYDADYYINNQVIPAALRILRVLGYSKNDLYVGQSSLIGF
ncbi:MAG: hypothetical protein DRP10_01785 [Candidatus Aenigmatarchaeota archaeon]|nr:MAG: hypothetical protein DRP10_01785 [Candidatus Aenigmarchaeota archaeon]